MILILEDDADREAYLRRGYFQENLYDDNRPPPTVWLSPEAYAKDVVLAELREKVEALESRQVAWGGSYVSRRAVRLEDVLALLDEREQ